MRSMKITKRLIFSVLGFIAYYSAFIFAVMHRYFEWVVILSVPNFAIVFCWFIVNACELYFNDKYWRVMFDVEDNQ